MTRPDPEVERRARERLAADEDAGRTTGPRRTSQSLAEAARQFWRHPSPWLISALVLGGAARRGLLADFHWTELVVPAALVLLLPVIEWVVHVVVLHWRPRRVAGIEVDPLLSRKHRAHHADPRDLPLVFIPWQAELWLIPAFVAVGLWVFPDPEPGATFLVASGTLMLGYEWVHHLVHSDYRPRSSAYRAIWRNHRLHHYKNEHYWFTVTTTGTADRLFGTCPAAGAVATSPTVRRLHAAGDLPVTGGPGRSSTSSRPASPLPR